MLEMKIIYESRVMNYHFMIVHLWECRSQSEYIMKMNRSIEWDQFELRSAVWWNLFSNYTDVMRNIINLSIPSFVFQFFKLHSRKQISYYCILKEARNLNSHMKRFLPQSSFLQFLSRKEDSKLFEKLLNRWYSSRNSWKETFALSTEPKLSFLLS